MINYSYTEIEDEKKKKNGEAIKKTTSHKLKDASIDDLTDTIRKLQAKGYDIDVTIKTKMPKG